MHVLLGSEPTLREVIFDPLDVAIQLSSPAGESCLQPRNQLVTFNILVFNVTLLAEDLGVLSRDLLPRPRIRRSSTFGLGPEHGAGFLRKGVFSDTVLVTDQCLLNMG